MTNREKTIKIFEIILEEMKGYPKEEAKKYAPENEGSEIWERIIKVVGSKQKNLQQAHVMVNSTPKTEGCYCHTDLVCALHPPKEIGD